MPHSRLSLIPLILGATLALGASECPEPETCDLGESGHFNSVEALECGLGPDGIALCHWSLSLNADGSFDWLYSDVGESGRWECEGDVVTGTGAGGRLIEGQFDAATHILLWDGVAYDQVQ